MVLRIAGASDLPAVLGLLDDVTRWAEERGIRERWPRPFPPAAVLEGIARNQVYLATTPDGAPAATMTLLEHDPRFWGDDRGDAGYVHRLAVRRELRGQSVGRWMLGEAAAAVRRRGGRLLRLDCWASNRRLREYYDAVGFAWVGESTVDGIRVALLEKKLE